MMFTLGTVFGLFLGLVLPWVAWAIRGHIAASRDYRIDYDDH